MQKSIQKMFALSISLVLFAMMAMPAQQSYAQVVPYCGRREMG